MTEPLTITTAQRDDNQLDLTITLGPERTEQALRQAAKLVARKARIPGFRPGKAPYATVLRLFGRDALLSEVLDQLGEEVFTETLEQEKLEPYGQAELKDVEMDPVSFKLVVPLPPAVELGDYRSVRVPVPEVVVTEADVDDQLSSLLDQRAAWQAVDRPAQTGDRVVLDIYGGVGDDKIMENRDWELTLREESGWLPGFDEAFVGMSAGDEKKFSLTYPEDSSSRYKGQTADFSAAVKEVRALVRPDVTDELVQELGDYADVADFRAKKLAELKAEADERARNEHADAAVQALIDGASLAYPPGAVDRMVDDMLRDLQVRLGGSGYSIEDFLRLQGTSVERYREQIRPAAERRLQGQLVLQKLGEVEQIEVASEESSAELERMVSEATSEDQAQMIREVFGSEQGQHIIYHDLENAKILARLREIVTGAAPELPAAATTAPVEESEPAAEVSPPAEPAEEATPTTAAAE